MIPLPSPSRPIVTIVGSYNQDLTCVGNRFPKPGETIMAERLVRGPGGKGSNQAIAAARFGANTRLVARLGNDTAGREALNLYHELGISTDYISTDDTQPTGAAVILVNHSGENMISIAPGANLTLGKADIDHALPSLQEFAIIGFQLESDLGVVSYGLRQVHEMGVTTFLDPAPAQPLPKEIYPCIDILKPNHTEASLLSGMPVGNVEQAVAAGEWFIYCGVTTVIITLGWQGTVMVFPGGNLHLPAPKVSTVDSTGAGDIFSGAFLASFASGMSLNEAVCFANAAAALSTERYGVIDSIPKTEQVLARLKNNQPEELVNATQLKEN